MRCIIQHRKILKRNHGAHWMARPYSVKHCRFPEMIYIYIYIYTLSYYHQQIGSMNFYSLFRVRSWNDGALYVFLYPVMIEIIYISCLIIIIKFCSGLGHETLVCAVCLSIFLQLLYHDLNVKQWVQKVFLIQVQNMKDITRSQNERIKKGKKRKE